MENKVNFKNGDRIVSTVYETMDYDKFSFIGENRKTDHVKAIIKSMRNRDVPNAILCNEKMEIIDGQNRFKARKEMGLPILYYCIDNLNIYDVASLNSFAKNWSNKDFVAMWASLGLEDYKIIERFSNDFKELGLPNCILILNLSMTHHSVGSDEFIERSKRRTSLDTLKVGKFKVTNLSKSTQIAHSIMRYKEFQRPGEVAIFKQLAFVSAMIKLLRDNVFENEEMIRKIKLYPTLFYRCINSDEYTRMLENIYNYRRTTHRIRFKY